VAAIHHLCETVQSERVKLRIEDIRINPDAARKAGVLAVPCLVCSPPPQRQPATRETSNCEALQRRIDQLEAALFAITNGSTDVLLVGANGPAGSCSGFFLPMGADQPYRDIVEQMADGVGTLSTDGQLLFANPRLAALLDRPAETLLGRPLAELIPASQRDCLERLRRVSAGRSERAEFELQADQGDPVRVLAVLTGLKGAGIATHCLTLTDLSDLTPPVIPGADEEHRDRLLAETVSAFLMETDAERHVTWASGEGPIPCRWLTAFQDAGEPVDTQQHRDFDPQIVVRAVRQPGGAVVDFVCAAANAPACRRYGLARTALVGRRLKQAFPAHVAMVLQALCQQALQSEKIARAEIDELSGTNAEERRSRLHVERVGDVLSCRWEGVESGKLRCQEMPPLLELVSPMQLIEMLSRRHPPGSRQTRPLAFALCDLRNFRVIHENHAAESAERVLEVIESRLRQILKGDAIVVRISDDQLLIAFDGMDNHEQAAAVAESIRVVISLPLPIPEGSPRIVPSVSIRLQQPGECMKALLRRVLDDGIPVPRVNVITASKWRQAWQL
jgi:PAS domain S-box-containing protein